MNAIYQGLASARPQHPTLDGPHRQLAAVQKQDQNVERRHRTEIRNCPRLPPGSSPPLSLLLLLVYPEFPAIPTLNPLYSHPIATGTCVSYLGS
jgi:hypothetical protein